MSTPPYIAPSIGPGGLTVPTYQSILADNIEAFLNIYGQNQYIAPDSAIYQLLSILSLKQADTMLAAQLVYNQSSPQTAVGAGLDRQVKMNGLARASYSYSSSLLTVTGTPGIILSNCFAQDQNGNLWALPSSVTIVGGSLNVTATCTTPGSITAEPGTINIINTPVAGWTGVTNANAAEPGLPVEADSELRARQSISVALPSLTPIAATIAAVLAVPGVKRIAPGYPTPGGPGTSVENPTGSVDAWGNPAHSISLVVDCTDTVSVAQAIYDKKTIGCYTNGTTAVAVVDKTSGVTVTIRFFLPSALPIYVLVTLQGYGSTPNTVVTATVQAALVNYLNDLAIGEAVSFGAMVYEAMGVNANLAAPNFGVKSLLLGTATVMVACTTTDSSNSLTAVSSAGIVIGQLVQGDGIPANAIVTAIAGTTITISQNATITASGVPVTFATLTAADVPMPNFFYAPLGQAANVVVVTA